jgi:hypothetical protein
MSASGWGWWCGRRHVVCVALPVCCRVDPGMELVLVLVLDMDRMSRAGGTRPKDVSMRFWVYPELTARASKLCSFSGRASIALSGSRRRRVRSGTLLSLPAFAISLHCHTFQSSSPLLPTCLPYRSALVYLPTQPNPFSSSSHPVYLFFHPSSAIIPTRFRIHFSVTLLHTLLISSTA